jgi:2-polyprenyl-3-methyl-5-hydroxy-6-metoxy-1,4-benzoquinol methylase
MKSLDLIIELRNKNFSNKEICRRLNEKSIPAPLGKPEWNYRLLAEFEAEDIHRRLAKISGPLHEKHSGISDDTLYGSFHYDKFNYTKCWRDTLQRFDQFCIPKDLSGKTVLDIGSNTGAMSFEFARRGAKVTGLEYNRERVSVCNELRDYLEVDAEFHHVDLNLSIPDSISCQEYDIVCCCAVDAYVDDQAVLYKFVSDMAKDTCYFESNHPSAVSKNITKEVEDVKKHFRSSFEKVVFIGQNGQRRVFVFSNSDLSFGKSGTALVGYHERKYFCHDEWQMVKDCYEKVSDIEQCVPMDFSRVGWVKSKHIQGRLLKKMIELIGDESIWIADPKLKESVKKQTISFIHSLIERGVSHRDIHTGNMIVDEYGKLFVIDWEWVVFDENMYDITGTGETPNGVRQTLFSMPCGDKLNTVAHVLGITKEDFRDKYSHEEPLD